MNRIDARRADRGDTSYVARRTTRRRRRIIPDHAELRVRKPGLLASFLPRRRARVDAVWELGIAVSLPFQPAPNDRLELDLVLGPLNDRFELVGIVRSVEPSPMRPGEWRVEMEYERLCGPLRMCLRAM